MLYNRFGAPATMCVACGKKTMEVVSAETGRTPEAGIHAFASRRKSGRRAGKEATVTIETNEKRMKI